MSLPYDLTPPHSASSDQFNCFADPIQLSDLVPMTPSHGQAMGYFYSSSTVAFPPTSSTQSFSSPSFAESFSEGLSHGQLSDGSYTTQPQLPILPSQSIHANYLDTTMWNETPLPMFETPTSPLQNMPNIKREQPVESPTYQAGTQRRRSRAVQDARRNSKALHRVQSGTGRPNAAARNGKRALRSTGSRSTGGHVKVAESAKFHCDAPGCLSGPYERNEHLKRHIKTYVAACIQLWTGVFFFFFSFLTRRFFPLQEAQPRHAHSPVRGRALQRRF